MEFSGAPGFIAQATGMLAFLVSICEGVYLNPWPLLFTIVLVAMTVTQWLSIKEQKRLRADLKKLSREYDKFQRTYVSWITGGEPESMIPGSSLFQGKPQPFTLHVYTRSCVPGSEDMLLVGEACVVTIRPWNKSTQQRPVVVTAMHVISSCTKVVTLEGPRDILTLQTSDFKPVGQCDAAYYPLSEVELMKLGASQAKIAPLPQAMPVQIYGRGMMSHGMLTHSSVAGLVEYDGSTIKGFSGSPYYVGKAVYGLHTTGQNNKQTNVGISMDFIQMLIRIDMFGRREDSSEYFEEVIKDLFGKNKLAWSYSHPTERDTVVFRDASGRYQEVDADDFDRWTYGKGFKVDRMYKADGRLENTTRKAGVLSVDRQVQTTRTPEILPLETGVYAESNTGEIINEDLVGQDVGEEDPQLESLTVSSRVKVADISGTSKVRKVTKEVQVQTEGISKSSFSTQTVKTTADFGTQVYPEKRTVIQQVTPMLIDAQYATLESAGLGDEPVDVSGMGPSFLGETPTLKSVGVSDNTKSDFPEQSVPQLNQLLLNLQDMLQQQRASTDMTGQTTTRAQLNEVLQNSSSEVNLAEEMRQLKGYLKALVQVENPKTVIRKTSKYKRQRDQLRELQVIVQQLQEQLKQAGVKPTLDQPSAPQPQSSQQ